MAVQSGFESHRDLKDLSMLESNDYISVSIAYEAHS